MARKAYNLEMAVEKPEEVEELSMVGLNLKRFPKEIFKFKQLKKLDLSGNQIAKLPRELNDFSQLTELQLGDNLLDKDSFSQFNFSNLPSLRLLSLSGNPLKKTPEGVFNLTNLEVLHLTNSQLTEIPPEILILNKLKWLHLSSNFLQFLPEEFGKLHELRGLELLNNQLVYLPDSFCQLKNLTRLELYGNPIKKLPSNFGELQSLNFLQMIVSKEFDPSLLHKQLKNLKILYLSGDGYAKVPEQIFQLTNLQNLRISSFSSTELPAAIGNLTTLTKFAIEEIPLKFIPESIGEMVYLEDLSIHTTEVKNIPASILHLKKLRHLGASKRLKASSVLRFITKAKASELSVDLQKTAFELIFHKKNNLEALSKKDLFTLLNFSFQNLEKVILNYIFNNFEQKNHPLNYGTQIVLLGKTNLNFQKIKRHLKNATRKVTPQTTHVILGKLPGEVENLASRDFVFVRESELNLWLQKQENPYLLNSSEEEIENLSRLLLSFQNENIDIALQIMDAGGVPEILLTDLVIVFKKLPASKQKRAIRKLLSLHLSEKALAVVSLKTGLLKATDLEFKVLELTTDTVLDGAKISKWLTASRKMQD